MQLGILWPAFALVALVFVVWATVVVQRFGHVRRTPPTRDVFRSANAAARYFEPVQLPADNLANLTETPVLFFALVPLLLLFHHAGPVQVVLAWAFVALRCAHSWFHVVKRQVRPRFRVFIAATAVLMAMWIGFAIDTISAAVAATAAAG